MEEPDIFDWYLGLSEQAKDAVNMALLAGSKALSKKKKELESAIQLIKDIAHLNYYGEVSDFANRWLKENGYEKI